MGIQFKERRATNGVEVHFENHEDSCGLRELRYKARLKGHWEVPAHYIVKRNGVIEDVRDVNQVSEYGGSLTTIDIICIGEVPNEAQSVSLAALCNSLHKTI